MLAVSGMDDKASGSHRAPVNAGSESRPGRAATIAMNDQGMKVARIRAMRGHADADDWRRRRRWWTTARRGTPRPVRLDRTRLRRGDADDGVQDHCWRRSRRRVARWESRPRPDSCSRSTSTRCRPVSPGACYQPLRMCSNLHRDRARLRLRQRYRYGYRGRYLSPSPVDASTSTQS
jgi:hypothetical protein